MNTSTQFTTVNVTKYNSCWSCMRYFLPILILKYRFLSASGTLAVLVGLTLRPVGFAHDLYVSFESDKIKNWCLQLKWHKIIVTPYPPSDATPKDYFQVGVNSLITHLNGCVYIARNDKCIIKDNF